jgi:hypothetical protein
MEEEGEEEEEAAEHRKSKRRRVSTSEAEGENDADAGGASGAEPGPSGAGAGAGASATPTYTSAAAAAAAAAVAAADGLPTTVGGFNANALTAASAVHQQKIPKHLTAADVNVDSDDGQTVCLSVGGKAWWMLLATSLDAIQLNNTGFDVRVCYVAGRCCSTQRHRMPFNLCNEKATCVSMTWL